MSRTTFAVPVMEAVATAIEADAALGALLAGDKVYSGIAPRGSPFPYVTISNLTEQEEQHFMLGGSSLTMTLGVWVQSPGVYSVGVVYDALNALLHGSRLPLSRGVMLMGKTRLVLVGAGDPNDPEIARGVVEYQVRACS